MVHTGKPYPGRWFTRESHILSVVHTGKPYSGRGFTREGRLLHPTTALGPSTIRTVDCPCNVLILTFQLRRPSQRRSVTRCNLIKVLFSIPTCMDLYIGPDLLANVLRFRERGGNSNSSSVLAHQESKLLIWLCLSAGLVNRYKDLIAPTDAHHRLVRVHAQRPGKGLHAKQSESLRAQDSAIQKPDHNRNNVSQFIQSPLSIKPYSTSKLNIRQL